MKCVFLMLLLALSACAQTTPSLPAPKPGRVFDEIADTALAAMKKRAGELKIQGAAVVAYVPGDSVSM